MAERREGGAEGDPTLTVELLVTNYLAEAERRLKKNTLRATRGVLDSFAARWAIRRTKGVPW
jgi:hypothetical protein